VKAFLKAGILSEDGLLRDNDAGTPQGSLCEASHNAPYEQRWVMRSVRRLLLVGMVAAVRRCA